MNFKNYNLSIKNQLIILLIFAFGLNLNTLFNDYAIDDVVVLVGNSLVKQGIKGIPKILSTESFYGYEKIENELPGGRYRPLALVLFAFEYQFFGINPFVSHLINVLLFTLLVALLFRILQAYVFREQHKYLAFITCLLFAAHPIHTEVIANVKSRDELITFILLLVSSFTFIKYSKKHSFWMLLSGLLCFFLALLTRESAAPFIAIVPLISYFFFNQSLKRSLLFSVPLVAVFIIYMAIRLLVVGFHMTSENNIMNAPFLYASHTEAFATKIFLIIKYLWLLVFPHPLSFDYGYNETPYIDISSLTFIFSFLLLLGLIAYAVFTFRRRSLFSFTILFFMMTIFLFSNLIIDIGAPLSERLLFQPSIAFCVVLAVFYLKAKARLILLANSALILILLLYSAKTISRNAEWKNNETLCFTDVLIAPNSVRTNQYAAHRYLIKAEAEINKELKESYFKMAISYDEKALKLFPHNQSAYRDMGSAYLGLNDYFKAADNWMQVYKLNRSDTAVKKQIDIISDLLYNEGNKKYKTGDIDGAIKHYTKAVELNESNADAWHNMSICYYKIHDTINGNIAKQYVIMLSAKNH